MHSSGSLNSSLHRFVEAQKDAYESAFRELQAGEKQGHWMWFIFPQLKGLGLTEKSDYYGIIDMLEAEAYLAHSLLGQRLIDCTRAILDQRSPVVSHIFPFPDNLKFGSCMTLFSRVPGASPVFSEALNKLLGNKLDTKTIDLLNHGGSK
jgi:uncharacterized protein (DUF1810 family)